MDFQLLKEIIQRDGGKVIIVEDDKPQMVVMSFEEYKRKGKNTPQPASLIQGESAASFVKPASQPASQLGGRSEPVQKSEERDRGDLTIDDLPLS